MAAPLAGLRVVELARVLAGPWAGQLLADLGADVVKVESLAGDDTRQWGPPFVENSDGTRDAAYFHSCNRGKRSIAVDFATGEGREIVRRLASRADVLIENFRVRGLRQYRLDYQALQAVNPRLVYCSVTGFGQTGPYAELPGYDFLIQAMGGIMDLTGDPGASRRRSASPSPTSSPASTRWSPSRRRFRARADGARAVDRHGALRRPGRGVGQPGAELSRLGPRPHPPRQCPPEHRPLPGLRGERRQPRHRRRQ